MSNNKKLKSFQDLSTIKNDVPQQEMSKEEYQSLWRKNKLKFRKMISEKNIEWLKDCSDRAEFILLEETNDALYLKINEFFDDERKRKWMIHIICNFFPLNESKQVVRLPEGKELCSLSNLAITDLDSIRTGKNDSRKKHLSFTGKKTDVILSGVALNELVRFVYHYVENYESRNGQIVNHALDSIRNSKNEFAK